MSYHVLATAGVALVLANPGDIKAPPVVPDCLPNISPHGVSRPTQNLSQGHDRPCTGDPLLACRADSLSQVRETTPYYGPVAMKNGRVYRVDADRNLAIPVMSVQMMIERMDRCEHVFGTMLPKCYAKKGR